MFLKFMFLVCGTLLCNPLYMLTFIEEATRNYIPGLEDSLQRDAQLYPWFPDRLNLEEVTDDWIEDIDTIQHEVCGLLVAVLLFHLVFQEVLPFSKNSSD